ncbi:hypothetical protein [Streptomyces humi]|uniref:hypothetical protein n=1 Tax=Streptomyces humi TaxID=1428620 RepID=UPI00062892C3|nr:hypothetical protein [Streptomyces humi]
MSGESNRNADADGAVRRRVLLGGVLALASGAVLGGAANAFAGTNAAFRWCRRCQGLWRPGAGDNGHCPVSHWWDHSHYVDGSGVYWFVDQGGDYSHDRRTNGNLDMKWCRTCKAAYWDAGGPTLCPNNPRGHTPSPETYRVETSRDFNPRYRHQAGWRACQNCFGYFFIGNGLGRTHCATGRWHVPLTVNRREIEFLPRYGNPPRR